MAFPLSLATLHTATGWGGRLLDEVPNHFLNHACSSLLPKPLNSSLKFRQAGLQFGLRGSGYHECCRHMLPVPDRMHQSKNERRNRYAGSRLQNFTVSEEFSAMSCAKLLRKLLRTECLRAFSTSDPMDFLRSRHQASTLLYSMTKELRHSHQ